MTSDAGQPTIFVIEDDADARDSLVVRLEAAGYRVAAYDAAEPFLAEVDPAADGCVITDVRLPEIDGLELLRRLNAQNSTLPVVVVTGFGDIPMAVRAMGVGAVDFLEKPFAPNVILSAVALALQVRRGERTLRQESIAAAARLATLTDRERDVVAGLAAGRMGKQIAGDLGLSPRTVEIHRARALEKSGAQSNAELIRLGVLASLYGGDPMGGANVD